MVCVVKFQVLMAVCQSVIRDVPNFEFGSKFIKSSRFFWIRFGSSFSGSNLSLTELFENFIFSRL